MKFAQTIQFNYSTLFSEYYKYTDKLDTIFKRNIIGTFVNNEL